MPNRLSEEKAQAIADKLKKLETSPLSWCGSTKTATTLIKEILEDIVDVLQDRSHAK